MIADFDKSKTMPALTFEEEPVSDFCGCCQLRDRAPALPGYINPAAAE